MTNPRVAAAKRHPASSSSSAFKRLLTTPDEGAFPRCPMPGCGRPSQAFAGKGLSQTHCRYHIQRRNRHGDYFKGTYTARELKPYRLAAQSYLKANVKDFWIAHALKALDALMRSAGPDERVVDVLRMKPPDKARAAFARMRSAEVPPLRLLVNYLAVTCAFTEDPIRATGTPDEYRLTQIAKAAMRMASGSHSYYSPGNQYDRYPRSSGLVLRHMGRMLEEGCEHVREEHLVPVLRLKMDRYGERDGRVCNGKVRG